jgi:hypothetical protein
MMGRQIGSDAPILESNDYLSFFILDLSYSFQSSIVEFLQKRTKEKKIIKS